MKKISILLGMAFMICFSFAACSDDEQTTETGTDTVEKYEPNELSTLQSNLVHIDENGKFVERVLGESLDAADTTEVSVGVDNYEEAVNIFSQLFADTTVISNNGTLATFSVEKGKVELKKVSDDKGTLATILFDVPGLKYVSKINFIPHSAWPENASQKGFHKLGAIYQYKGWTAGPGVAADDDFDADEMFNYVCIREYSDGVPALLVAITPKSYYMHCRGNYYSGRIPGEPRAKNISKILQSNWGTYKTYFNAAYKDVLTDDTKCWIDRTKDYGFAAYRWDIKLKNGYTEKWDIHWKEPRRQVLFFVESSLKL